MRDKTSENLVDTLRGRHLYAEKLWLWAVLTANGPFTQFPHGFPSMEFYIDLLNQGKTK